jgi:hypothetical protein
MRTIQTHSQVGLLQTEQHENLARAFLNRLKRFADNRSRTVNLDAARD